jgi:hypothetical protein
MNTNLAANWLDDEVEPTKKIENLPSAALVRRERLRSRLHMAVDQAVDRDEATARATLDALLAVEGGAQ